MLRTRPSNGASYPSALEVEPGLLQGSFGGLEGGPCLGQLGLTQGQRAGLTLTQVLPLLAGQLGLGELQLQTHACLGDLGLGLGESHTVVAVIDAQKSFTTSEEPTLGKGRRDPIEPARRLRRPDRTRPSGATVP